MKKKLISLLLALAMAVSWLAIPAGAVETAPSASSGNPAAHWFYDQLSEQGQKIYDALWEMFSTGMMRDGKTSYDLVANGVVTQAAVRSYLDGNRTLFSDFAAAKDAFDLEHPEAWYMDSSDLSFRVTSESNGALHAYMGPGRTEDYYVSGVSGADDALTKTAELNTAVSRIAAEAKKLSADFEKVQYVHEQITKGISYRFETDCKAGNAGYIRTAYALVTHEGVCEGYVRSFQMVLNELEIPCVPIHGVQTSGTPEQHMWCAVRIGGEWYAVDPTWDDPIGLDVNGRIKQGDGNGKDGGETETYLLVGLDVIGGNWHESGVLSDGGFEFGYPVISLTSYASGALERNGLKVEYAKDTMEGAPSTVYKISYNGDGLVEAAKKGYYFLVKMYDVNADGSVDEFDDWYYSVHGLHAVQDTFDPNNDFHASANSYLGDTDGYMVYNVINCEYVEFAITTKAPPNWQSADDLYTMGGYYSGDYTDILAETGLIYNENGGYEQPPAIKNYSPGMNSSIRAGRECTMHVEFSDELYRPNRSDVENAMEGKLNDAETALNQSIGIDYVGTTSAWGMIGRQPHTFTNKPPVKNMRYLCSTCQREHTNTADIRHDCRIYGVEFEFTSSAMWADDSVYYEFILSGLVGIKSNKLPNHFGWIFENVYPYTTCRLCTPYDWNMWGQPMPLANPDGLDFDRMTVEGIDGQRQSVTDLIASTHLDPNDMNGRLMLVVEGLGNNREMSDTLDTVLEQQENVPNSAVLAKSLFEIDFVRVCTCMIVETGQAVRLCVGFPEGIDPSMVGLTFKAYHFTRDANNEVNGVEEIPCTVTPLGLVITCMSFSPFMIAAIDAEEAGLEIPVDTTRYLFVNTEGYGSILVDGKPAGMVVEFTEGAAHRFEIKADTGYAFDGLTSSGVSGINISGSMTTFTLAYDDIAEGNALLGVSFAAGSVKQAEAAAGQKVETPTVCDHANTTTYIEYLAPTCTEDGHTAKKTCKDCGQVLAESIVLSALGHNYVDGVCERCGMDQQGNIAPKPVTDAASGTTTVSVSPSSTSVSGSTAAAAVGRTRLEQAVDAVVAEAAKRGTVPVVRVEVSIASDGVDALAVTLPSSPLAQLAGAKGSSLAILSDVAGITLDNAALTALADQASGDTVTFTITPVAASALNEDQRKALDGTAASVTELSIVSNNTAIRDFKGGVITVSLPYALPGGQAAEDVAACCLADDGTLTPCDTVYADGKVTFTAASPGRYAITPPQGSGKPQFTDVPADSYFADAVAWAVEQGITIGYGDASTFAPYIHCNRGEIVTFLWRAAGKPEVPAGTENPFTDISESNFFYDAALWAFSEGITTGVAPDTFSPYDPCTRAQIVTFLWRYKGRPAAEAGASFTDVEADSWYTDAVSWAVETEVTLGKGDNLFAPNVPCLRCEAVTFLFRASDK